MQKVKLAAHRGYSALYPENTMAAFRAALTQDIDMIETDVHMTRDGELVLIHDHALSRTTDGGDVLVRDATFATVKKADAGSWKGAQFTGERVPSFREFLELVAPRKDIEINVELKDYPKECGAFAYESCDKALAMMDEFGVTERSYINSFSGDILNYVHTKYGARVRLHGYYPVALLGDQFNENIWKRCFCVCMFNVAVDENGKRDWSNQHHVCPQEAFDLVAKYGAERWYYYKEDRDDLIKTALERGITGITSNDIVAAAAILKKYNAR